MELLSLPLGKHKGTEEGTSVLCLGFWFPGWGHWQVQRMLHEKQKILSTGPYQNHILWIWQWRYYVCKYWKNSLIGGPEKSDFHSGCPLLIKWVHLPHTCFSCWAVRLLRLSLKQNSVVSVSLKQGSCIPQTFHGITLLPVGRSVPLCCYFLIKMKQSNF